MTKIDIVSGFLGAGKTTLIKKLLAEAFSGEKLVLIENEFGEISIDGGFLKESGVQISEMSSGCICCSLVGDFGKALVDVQKQFDPDRILIEPSGVGKLSDVILAVENTVKDVPEMKLNSFVTVADASKVKVYMKNFGEFYNNQIETASTIILSRTDSIPQSKLETAGTIILSRTQKVSPEKLQAAAALLREKNPDAAIITTPWDELSGQTILAAMEKVSLADELMERIRAEHEAEEEEHHHHAHEDEEHEHHHHDDHDGDEHDHHHDREEGACCHEDHHAHDHDHHGHGHHHHDGGECDDPHCACHHHHHHADEVFTSWGAETPKTFTETDIRRILAELDTGAYGVILRAKGIVPTEGGKWLHFDYVPQEHEVRFGAADYTGRLCVIGSKLDEGKLKTLFSL